MGIAGDSPLPWKLGGGKSRVRQAYDQIRHAVGVGGSAEDDTGIDGLWRRSKAKGLAAASSAERRAVLQAFPRFATDTIPYYERIHAIIPPAGATLQQRVEAIERAEYAVAVSATSELEAALQDLDSRISLLNESEAAAIVTQFGRAFEAHDTGEEGPAWNSYTGKNYTEIPNFSTHQVVRVRFAVGYSGALTVKDRAIHLRLQRLLRKHLPSDVDFSISTETWKLGSTPIGFAALGPQVDPVGAIFGANLSAYYGADPESWLTDTSGNGYDLSDIGVATPTYENIGLRRALLLQDDVLLENTDVAAVVSGTNRTFSVLAMGEYISGTRTIWDFSHSSGSGQHRGIIANAPPDIFTVQRISDAASSDIPVSGIVTTSHRIFSHAYDPAAGLLGLDNSFGTSAYSGNPVTVDRFRIGGAGTGKFRLHRLAIIDRVVTQAEVLAFRELFL